MKPKKSFILYHDYIQWFDLLSDKDLAELIRAIFAYEADGILPTDISPCAALAFTMVKTNLDRDREKYKSVCERNQTAANARWKKLKVINKIEE